MTVPDETSSWSILPSPAPNYYRRLFCLTSDHIPLSDDEQATREALLPRIPRVMHPAVLPQPDLIVYTTDMRAILQP